MEKISKESQKQRSPKSSYKPKRSILYIPKSYSPKPATKQAPLQENIFEDNIEYIKSTLPIPKGDNSYSMAKTAEYYERDIEKAEYYYRKAIIEDDRKESAIKDLASLLHQKGKTADACKLLTEHKDLFLNSLESYTDLLNNLQKQLDTKGNNLMKELKISGLKSDKSEATVKALFKNAMRIKDIHFDYEIANGLLNNYCILKFNSHSSARKTLEGFGYWDKHTVEWLSSTGEIVCDAHYAKQRIDNYRKNNPTFEHKVFERDPKGYLYTVPLDPTNTLICEGYFKEFIEKPEVFLGKILYSELFDNL